jgi:hypothetical protein
MAFSRIGEEGMPHQLLVIIIAIRVAVPDFDEYVKVGLELRSWLLEAAPAAHRTLYIKRSVTQFKVVGTKYCTYIFHFSEVSAEDGLSEATNVRVILGIANVSEVVELLSKTKINFHPSFVGESAAQAVAGHKVRLLGVKVG